MFNLFEKKTGYEPNHKSRLYIGEIVEVIEEIKYGKGRGVAHDLTQWDLEGDDAPISSKVKVIDAIDGATLLVEIAQ